MYLDEVLQRGTVLLLLLIDAMHMSRTTDVQYFIQQSAPVVLREFDRAQALRKSLY